MRKKKVLIHGTSDSVKKFLADAVSWEYDIIAVLSEELEKISISRNNTELEVIPTQSLPNVISKLVDAVILTSAETKEAAVNFFLKRGFEYRKIIVWNADKGWEPIQIKEKDGKQVNYLCGLEIHNEALFKQTFSRLQTNRKLKNMNPQSYPSFATIVDNPKTLSEKIRWIKVYDATPIKSRLTDKYLVRNWVAEKIGEKYLIPLLGVWDEFDDINFDELPDQFVLKCNHGCGMNIVVRDKKSFNKQNAREKINAWLAVDYAFLGLELHYTRINRKIIAEKFMRNGDSPDLIDYKFNCFDGKVNDCQYITNRSSGMLMDYFDTNWQVMDIERGARHHDHPEKIPKPKNFELMKELATKLAEGFPLVRVDFYEIEDRVYFGEMTFTPGCGNIFFQTEGVGEYMGSLVKLPKVTPPRATFSKNKRTKKFFLHPLVAYKGFFLLS